MQKNESKFVDKEQENIYRIITGQIKFKSNPFHEIDIEPDLIIKIKVPEQQNILSNKCIKMTSFITNPPQRLQRAYTTAQEQIIQDMNNNNENDDPNAIKIRLFKSIKQTDMKRKEVAYINHHEQSQQFNIECVHEKRSVLDIFTLQYNSIVYILQKRCGFRVRAFMVYDQDGKNKQIYLFLSLSLQNLLKIATNYSIKKQLDYSIIDFYLNQATSSDDRQLKFHSELKKDSILNHQMKKVSRYFNVLDSNIVNSEIIKQKHLTDQQKQKYIAFSQDSELVFDFFKQKVQDRLSNQQKIYIYEINKGKINPGCQKIYSNFKKRKQYFLLMKDILKNFGYDFHQAPVIYQQFFIPDKNTKGVGFFSRLKSILAYKQNQATPHGDLSLFLSMEKTKLCYMMIKNEFKLSHCAKIGMDIFTLDKKFQRDGQDNPNLIQGGLDGTFLASKWRWLGIFSDFRMLRNYYGQVVAHEAFIRTSIFGYLLAVSFPFVFMYAMQQIYKYPFYLSTSIIETSVYAISFLAFAQYIKVEQQKFVKKYCDRKTSMVFLNSYRGPFVRNPVTDEVNQFKQDSGFGSKVINVIITILMLMLFIMIGFIFYGFRQMVLSIGYLSDTQIYEGVTLSHFFSYITYFAALQVFKFIISNNVLKVMVFLKNPPSDQFQRIYTSNFKFFYNMGEEFIPLLFFLVIQPIIFQSSCFNNGCDQQLTNYIYTRYLVKLVISLVLLGYVLVFGALKNTVVNLIKNNDNFTFQQKLKALLEQSIKQSKKPTHKDSLQTDLVILLSFTYFNTQLPLSPAISLITILSSLIRFRMGLLYEQRRPINRSQGIVPVSKYLTIMYGIGLVINIWIQCFIYQGIPTYMPDILKNWSDVPDKQSVFLFKGLMFAIAIVVLSILGNLMVRVYYALSDNTLQNRMAMKYHEYIAATGGIKLKIKQSQHTFLNKSIFRTNNPQITTYDQVQSKLQKYNLLNPEGKTQASQEGDDSNARLKVDDHL